MSVNPNPPMSDPAPGAGEQATNATSALDAMIESARQAIETSAQSDALNAPNPDSEESGSSESGNAAETAQATADTSQGTESADRSVNPDGAPASESGDQTEPPGEGESASRRAKASSREEDIQRRIDEAVAAAVAQAQREAQEAQQRAERAQQIVQEQQQLTEQRRSAAIAKMGDPAEVQRRIRALASGDLTYEEQQELQGWLDKRDFYAEIVQDAQLEAVTKIANDMSAVAATLEGVNPEAISKATGIPELVRALHAAGAQSKQAEIDQLTQSIAAKDDEIARLNGEILSLQTQSVGTGRAAELGGASAGARPGSGLGIEYGPDGLPTEESINRARSGRLVLAGQR